MCTDSSVHILNSMAHSSACQEQSPQAEVLSLNAGPIRIFLVRCPRRGKALDTPNSQKLYSSQQLKPLLSPRLASPS